jgi:hypothetical protein
LVLSGENAMVCSTPRGNCGCGSARRVTRSRTTTFEKPSSFTAYASRRSSSERVKFSTSHFTSGVSTVSLPLAMSICTSLPKSLSLSEIT